MKQLTLGSLFSGAGGFELAGTLCGIKPLWASEIEPFPIRVTTKRFPDMAHLGDIRRIDGAAIPPADIVCFGSPCTNLSIANNRREGLAGEQSGLFFEAIRIIKEMRESSSGTYPRFICFENVPGVFSSNDRADFRRILTEIVQIIAPEAEVPAPDKDGWPRADILLGDRWSVAYRTLDAQHFGVPQRRERVFLVADFGSQRAGDILFEPEGLCRDAAPCFRAWRDLCGPPADGAGAAGSAIAVENHPADSRLRIRGDGIVQTLSARMGTGGNNTPLVLCAEPHPEDAPYVLRRITLTECAALQGFPKWWCAGLETPKPSEEDITFWSEVFETHRRITGKAKTPKSRNQIVKWLRNPRGDSAEYKMWGNSLAIPCALFVLEGIVELVREEQQFFDHSKFM